MRKVFIKTLIGLAGKDKRIFLLTGDLGFSILEEFKEKFPDRFLNMGVAEQNMMGVAAGLALSGKIVFVYSIIPFLTMRCFEQIRNDVCFQNLNVRLVGVGAGLAYGPAGATHYALEDIAIMRALANMTIFSPGDPKEIEACTRLAAYNPGPAYIRLGKEGAGPVHSGRVNITTGKAVLLEDGKDFTIIASGPVLFTAKKVCEKLKRQRLSVRLISMPTVKPLDKKIITDSAGKTKAMATIEEHSLTGGLGSAVSEVLAESGAGILFKRCALKEGHRKIVGSRIYLLCKEGLSESGLVKSLLKMYADAGRRCRN